MQSGGDAARSTLLAAIELARRVGDTDLLGPRGAQPGRLRPVAGHGRRRPRRRARGGAAAACRPTAARCARACSCAWPSRCTTPSQAQRREELVQEALGIARGLDDPPTLAYVLDQGHIATNGPDTAERGLAWAHELFALADAAGDPELSVRARSWQIDLLLELDDLAGRRHGDRGARPHRHRLARPARPRLHPAAPRAAGHDLRPPRRHRGAHPRGHPAGLEPAGLDRPDPRRRAALLAAPGPGPRCASSRTRCASSPISCRPCPRGAWRWPCSTCTPAARRRRAASTTASPSATSRPSRATTSGRSPSRMLAELERDLPRRRALGRCSKSCSLPLDGRNVVTPTGIFAGPVRRYLALTAAARGDQDTALARLAEARMACERMGYKPMLAVLDVDEARMLARRDQPGDVERRPRAAAARARCAPRRSASRASTSAWPAPPRCCPRQDDAPAPPPSRAAGPARAVLAREGDVWRLDYEGRVLRVRDAKGMRHLALLLANPGVEFHAVDVATAAEGGAAPGARERRRAGRARRHRRRGPGAGLPGQGRVPHAPGGPAGRDRGGRVLQRPRARGPGARGDGLHRARAVGRRRPGRARPPRGLGVRARAGRT